MGSLAKMLRTGKERPLCAVYHCTYLECPGQYRRFPPTYRHNAAVGGEQPAPLIGQHRAGKQDIQPQLAQ